MKYWITMAMFMMGCTSKVYFITNGAGGIILCKKMNYKTCGALLEECSTGVTYHCVHGVGELTQEALDEKMGGQR